MINVEGFLKNFINKQKTEKVSYILLTVILKQNLPNNTLIITISITILSIENINIYLSLCWLCTLEPLLCVSYFIKCIIALNKCLNTDLPWKTPRKIVITVGVNIVSQGEAIISTGLICFSTLSLP